MSINSPEVLLRAAADSLVNAASVAHTCLDG